MFLLKKTIYLIIALTLSGSIVKITGGLFHSSKALFVDALTCIANIIALIFTTYYYRLSKLPPDIDHPKGHHRYGLGGSIVTLTIYGYVAGVVSVDLIYTREYVVDFNAIYFAISGFILYALSIYLSLRVSRYYRAYGFFTVVELYESSVTIVAVLLGALYYYLIDYVGAIGLTIYLIIGIIRICRETIHTVASEEVYID